LRAVRVDRSSQSLGAAGRLARHHAQPPAST
jgi:hypothetical protein